MENCIFISNLFSIFPGAAPLDPATAHLAHLARKLRVPVTARFAHLHPKNYSLDPSLLFGRVLAHLHGLAESSVSCMPSGL